MKKKWLKQWTKDEVEAEIKKMGLAAAERYDSDLGVVFVAEGFKRDPWPSWKSLGIVEGEFPMGCYCAFWFVAKDDEHVDVGVPLFFDPMHTCERSGLVSNGWDKATMRQARVASALREAAGYLAGLKEMRDTGVINALVH